MKHLAQAVPISMIVFFRNWVVLVVLLPILFRNPPQRLWPQRPWIHVLRAVTGVDVVYLPRVFAARADPRGRDGRYRSRHPLWGIVISALFLGEAVRARRLSATVLGFAGVLFIVRPQVEIDPAMLVALAGAFLATMSMAYLKQLTASEPPILIMITFSLIGTGHNRCSGGARLEAAHARRARVADRRRHVRARRTVRDDARVHPRRGEPCATSSISCVCRWRRSPVSLCFPRFPMCGRSRARRSSGSLPSTWRGPERLRAH